MNKMKKVTILLVLFCFWICANGQQIEEARNMATKLLAHYPGLSVAVGIKDSIIWSEGFGYADVTHKVCVTENTTFRMYSLSKSITGIALAKLISAGTVSYTHLDVYKRQIYDSARLLFYHVRQQSFCDKV